MSSKKFAFQYDPSAGKRAKAPIILTVPDTLDDDEDEQSQAVPYQEEEYQADNEEDDDDDDIICYCASRVKKQQEQEAFKETVIAHGMDSDTAATETEEELLKRLWKKGRPPPQISKQDPQVSSRELQLVRKQTYGVTDDENETKCNC
ncbi:hypothetical protein CBL_00488 [Carabus blaptoides fortunei]